jgi:stress response protein SCP2
MDKHIIAFEHGKIIKSINNLPLKLKISMHKEFTNNGYLLSDNALNSLSIDVFLKIMNTLCTSRLYPNFPYECIDEEDIIPYLNNINLDYKKITIINEDDFVVLNTQTIQYYCINEWYKYKKILVERITSDIKLTPNQISYYIRVKSKSKKVKKFNRSDRRLILNLIENSTLDLSEMKSQLGRWIRIGEILHPFEYKNIFPKTYEAFDELRNNSYEIKTFNAKLNDSFLNDTECGLNVLSQKPHVYIYKFEWLCKNFDKKKVIYHSKNVLPKVDDKLLLKSLNYTKDNLIKNTLIDSLKVKYSNKYNLGNVYLDDELKNIPYNFDKMYDLSHIHHTLIRGTKIKNNNDYFDCTLKWNDPCGTLDMDLLCVLLDKNFKVSAYITYTYFEYFKISYHTGDVKKQKGDCKETIHLDLNNLKEKDISYVAFQVKNLNRDNMYMDECYINNIRLCNNNNNIIAGILDVYKNEFIWLDMFYNLKILCNIEHFLNIKKYINNKDITVYDVLKIHTESRGNISNENIDNEFTINNVDYLLLENI